MPPTGHDGHFDISTSAHHAYDARSDMMSPSAAAEAAVADLQQ